MSNRITAKDLRGLAERINAMTGSPPSAYTRTDAGSRANVGHYFIDAGSKTYGRAWALSRMMNAGGGQENILRASTAHELHQMIHAWLDGYREGWKEASDYYV